MFELGDIVRANPPDSLHCGSSRYTHAIVVSANPLMLVSEETDMLWSATVSDMKLEKIGKASSKVLADCMKRLVKDIEVGRILLK